MLQRYRCAPGDCLCPDGRVRNITTLFKEFLIDTKKFDIDQLG